MSNFWIPKTGEELQNLASILTNNDRERLELMRCHAWFGHFFDGHLGKVQANTSVIQGKPALLSDTLVGICYQYGLVRRLSVVESTATHCTVEAERNDEPVGEVHRFTFTWEMARRMNLVRANWNKQPANMLKKRARAFIVREVFPEAVSGLYTIDEMADHSNLSENEIDQLQARSTGFDDYRPNNSRPPMNRAPSAPPQPAQKKTELTEVNDLDADLSREYRKLNSENDFFEVTAELGIDKEEVIDKCKAMKFDLTNASANDRSEFLYSCIVHDVIRQSTFIPHDWQSMSADHKVHFHLGFSTQYPILNEVPIDWYQSRVNMPAFAEMLQLTNELTPAHYDQVLRAMQSYPANDWRLFDYVECILDVLDPVEDEDEY